jgi:hypothetical protein
MAPTAAAEHTAIEISEDEITDRLSLLNAQRAEEERREALLMKTTGEEGRPKGKRENKSGGAEENQISFDGCCHRRLSLPDGIWR